MTWTVNHRGYKSVVTPSPAQYIEICGADHIDSGGARIARSVARPDLCCDSPCHTRGRGAGRAYRCARSANT